MININKLREWFSYNPDTGTVTRRCKASNGYMSTVPVGSKCKTNKSAKTEYLNVNMCGKKYYVHRLAWALYYGEWPVNEIDHEDHNGLNNRIDNLKEKTTKQNTKNNSMRSVNTSGVTGVSWSRSRCKWVAQINIEGVATNLGRFDSKEDAIACRRRAETKYGYHANHGK